MGLSGILIRSLFFLFLAAKYVLDNFNEAAQTGTISKDIHPEITQSNFCLVQNLTHSSKHLSCLIKRNIHIRNMKFLNMNLNTTA